MKKNFPKILLLVALAFFAVSIVVFLFFFRAIKNNNDELLSKEAEWQTEALRRDGIKALDHSIKTIESERAQLGTHFAQSSNIVPFLDTIEALGPKVGVKAEVTSVDILEDGTGLSVGLKALGPFGGFYKFFKLLENSPYEIEFISMDMHHEAQSTDANNTSPQTSNWNAIFKIKLLTFVK